MMGSAGSEVRDLAWIDGIENSFLIFLDLFLPLLPA